MRHKARRLVKQTRGMNLKRISQLHQEDQRRVFLAALNAREIAHRHARFMGKRFLAEPFRSPQSPHIGADSILPSHGRMGTATQHKL